MDTKDVLTLILSGLAFLVSLGSYRISRRSALLAERTAARAEEKDKQAARVAAVVQKNDI